MTDQTISLVIDLYSQSSSDTLYINYGDGQEEIIETTSSMNIVSILNINKI